MSASAAVAGSVFVPGCDRIARSACWVRHEAIPGPAKGPRVPAWHLTVSDTARNLA